MPADRLPDEAGRAAFLAYARQALTPLHSLELEQDGDNLEVLAKTVGDARIVGIGESWHSARQLLQIRHRLVRHLVERQGFDLLIFEGSLPGAVELDDYVAGGSGDPAIRLRALGQAMWLNAETAAFLVWLREFNAGRPAGQRVRVAGMDSVPPTPAPTALPAYLQRVDPGYAIPAAELIRTAAAHYAAAPLDSLSRAAIWGGAEAHGRLSEAERGELRSAVVELVARLESRRASYGGASSAAAVEWALRKALVMLQACDILDARLVSPRLANERRDLAFAENVAWQIEQAHPGARAVLFGHNIHMAREPFLSFDAPAEPVPSTGCHLDRWYGRGYAAIGAAVGLPAEGTSLVDRPEPGSAREAAWQDSIDAALQTLVEPCFLLPLALAPAWAAAAQPMRSHLQPSTDYRPARAFDLLAFTDRIDAATPLP